MPLTGTLDLSPLASDAPLVEDLGTGTWELKEANVLQIFYEIDDSAMTSLLPPALHPTIPPTVVVNGTRVPDSSVGPFTLAEVRVGCRAATRPRGFLARAFCDSEAAAEELRRRWGYPVDVADVRLTKNHFQAQLTVDLDGENILDAVLIDPEPISGGDIQYLANLNLSRIKKDGETVTRLIQVDPDFVFHSADRGLPAIHWLDSPEWRLDEALPVYPVSASYTRCDITMPTIRFLIDPEQPPLQSVERVNRE
jgi:hypothetical protein